MLKKIIFILICSLSCSNYPLVANETDDLLKLFHLAVENGNLDLVKDVIDALLKSEHSSKYLLDALAKYSEQGKVDFALHNAIKDKNLLASVILTHYSKDVNTRRVENDIVWITSNSGTYNTAKTPIELALQADMIEIIPYLLMKKANPHLMRKMCFFYEGEENLDYMVELGYQQERRTCVKSKKEFVFFSGKTSFNFSRTFIGEAIAKNRLDIIEILQKTYCGDWNVICCTLNGRNYTPLQYSLAIQRYEVAQFLIDHGARIE